MPKKNKVRKGTNKWLAQIFGAKQVNNGGIVRRAKINVERLVSLDVLKEEIEKRRFHLIEFGNQYVVLCNKGNLNLIC